MADRDLMAGIGVNQALDLGTPVPGRMPGRLDPRTGRPPDQAPTGLGNLQSTRSDVAIERERALSNLLRSAPEQRRPQMQPFSGIYYDPSRNRYSVGGEEFGAEEYNRALETRSIIGQQGQPTTPGNWQPVSLTEYQSYLNSLAEGRGLLGNVGMGFRDVGEAVVGGAGRGLQMLGAEGAGGALVEAGEFLGPTEAQDARDVFIREQQGLGRQIGAAALRSLPTLGLSVAGGLGGAAAAARLGATARGALTAGAGLGAAAPIYPMEIQSAWETAEANGWDVEDPEVQSEINRNALINTVAQSLGPAVITGGFSRALNNALGEATRNVARSRISRGLGAGALEGSAEAFAQLTNIVTFDPELRAQMNEADWAAMAPLIADKYGEDLVIAFGAGALLGGVAGAAGRPPTAPEAQPDVEPDDVRPQRNLTSDEEVNVLNPQPALVPPEAPAGLLPAPEVAPPAGIAPPAGPAGLLGPSTIVTPPPAGEPTVVVPPPPGARPLAPMPEGLEGPVAAGYQQAEATGPGFRPAPPVRAPEAPTPSVGATPAPVQPDVPDVAAYAPEGPATGRPFAEQFDVLRQRQAELAQRAEAARQAEAAQQAQATAANTAQQNQLLQARREQQAALADAETIGNILLGERYPILGAEARATWERAVRNVDPETRTEVAALFQSSDPDTEEATAAGRQVYNELNALAETLRRRVSPNLRRQANEPIRIPVKPSTRIANPIEPGVYGNPSGAPYKTQFRAAGQRGKIAEELTESTDQLVTEADLEVVEVPGGYGLRLRTEPEPEPTPPAGGAPSPIAQGRQAAQARRQRGAARVRGETNAVQEPSPAEVDVREQAQAGEGVRVEDTQEAGATRARQTQDIFEQTEVAPRPRAAAGQQFLSTRQMASGSPDTEVGAALGRDRRQPAARSEEDRRADLQRSLTERADALTDEQSLALMDELDAYGFEDIDTAISQAPEDVQRMIGRVETRTRAVEQAKARKAAEAPSVESASPPTSEPDTLAEGFWNDIRSTREDRAEIPRFEDLPEAQQDAWINAAAGGSYASKKSGPALSAELVSRWKSAGLKLPRTSDPVTTFQRIVDEARAADRPTQTDLDATIEAVDDAELDLKGGYPDEKARAAADLVILRDDPSTPVDVQQRITDILETNLTQRQLTDAEVAAANETPGRASRTTFNFVGGQYTDLDGNPITRALPHGRAKMLISSFRKKLKRAPKIKEFTNVEQLRRKSPELYARAAAAREQGDFDRVTAAGYSFGDGEVIIFTDNIANEAHLRFVLAHETMGHYGLRGFIPADKFNAVMNEVYEGVPRIQAPIDAAVAANEGLSRAEAVEEFLSDYAAQLETNIILRVRNAIKDALNALGIKFYDDYMRYLLRHARAYARNPGAGRFADADAIAQEANRVETAAGMPGRYAQQRGLFDSTNSAMQFARLGLDDAPTLADIKGTATYNLPTTWQDAKNELLSLFGYQARKNPGLQHGYELFMEAADNINNFRNIVNEVMAPALNGASKIMFTNLEFGGIKEKDVQLANSALAKGRIRAAMALQNNPKLSQSKTPIFRYNEATGQFVPTGEAERLDAISRLKIEDFREGFTVEVPREGTGEVQTVVFEGDPNITEDSPAFKAYNATRDGFLLAEKRALLSKLTADTATFTNMVEDIEGVLPEGQRLTGEQRRLIKRAARMYSDLYSRGAGVDSNTGELQSDPAAIARAEEFLRAFNTAVIANKPASADTDLGDPNSAATRNKTLADIVATEAGQQEADDIVAGIEDFKNAVRDEAGNNRLSTPENKFLVQTKVAAINHTQFQAQNGEQGFRNRVTMQYTPIVQQGRFQLKMHAVDAETGAYVALGDEYAAAMGYTQFATRAEAKQFADALRKQLQDDNGNDITFDVRAGVPSKDGGVAPRKISIATTIDMVETDVLAPTRQSLSEFMTLLQRYNIALAPQKQQQLVMDLTRQDDRARKRLLTEYVAGDPETGIENVAKYVEGLASTSTKILMRPKMERLTSPFNRWSRQMWSGDKPGLDQAKAKYERLNTDPGADPEAVKAAKYDYQMREYMYDQTVTTTEGLDREQKVNMYRNQLGKAIAFTEDYRQVVDSDLDANGFISRWRSLTAQFQLGFSAATALLNPVSVYTNTVPYLASRNAKTGFGGGFGLRALGEVNLAFQQVGTPGVKPTAEGKKFNTADFYDEVAGSETLQKKYRLSKYEARMLAQEIRDGSMQPALTNMLLNTARGASMTNFGRIVSDVGMFMFNTTEQASRRAAGLAAFRMQFGRLQAAIDPDLEGAEREQAVEQAYREATNFVAQTLRLTVGEYSAINRPNAFRGGIGGILYMYKVFPVTSIQLFNNMGIGGKAGMAMTLFLMGGLSALPFAEDLEDIVDTVDQQFGVGFGEGSIRATATRELEKVFPGWSKSIISGFAGAVLPGDVGSRVSLSPIPGTEMFLAGSDRMREFMDILGPMPAALEQSVGTVVDAVRAPFSPTIGLEDVARESPITAARLLADSYAYYSSGAVIDRRGYVVAPDVQWYDIAARLMGFYPTRAADDYATIRVVNRIANYRRERAADYRARWVSYRIRNDRDGMREIEEAVRNWNKTHRGTPLEIANFREGANRAYREATRPALERTLRTTPTAGRSEFEAIMDALTR